MSNPSNFVISTRNIITRRNGDQAFGNEPGETTYLEVPASSPVPTPTRNMVMSRDKWVKKVTARATTGKRKNNRNDPRGGFFTGNVLIFVHGYNNSMGHVMQRHDYLQQKLFNYGYKGAIVSFDWPSAELTIGYMEDRLDALATAQQLVTDGISILVDQQKHMEENKCDIDVHLLGHSTGAYVIREAFYQASHNTSLSMVNWNVSQVAFIGGDIARKSMSRKDGKSKALFERSARITNYQNPFDSALKVSSIKRAGLAPRVGRVGLPDDPPRNVVNVNTADYWDTHKSDLPDSAILGNNSHSWHFDDDWFSRDLAYTLEGDIDRMRIPTRTTIDGELHLRKDPT